MKFRYRAYGEYLRPVIPIKLSYKNKSVECEVLVDSGSDKCLFDYETGESIGITRKNSEIREIYGVGGDRSLYYFHPVTLEVGGVSFNIKAGFIPSMGGRQISYGIVGQKGFFDKFIVKFDLLKEEVELKEIK